MAHRQEKAELAALKTPEGVASISAPLRFRAEETEMCARWRSLRPGTPYVAGLAADLLRALRRAGHRVSRCTPLFPRGAGPHLNKEPEHGWGCSVQQPLLTTSTSSEEERSHFVLQYLPVYIYLYIFVYINLPKIDEIPHSIPQNQMQPNNQTSNTV